MNSSLLSLSLETSWQLIGWTMILFLAEGMVVLLIGGMVRMALRRAGPTLRYATSLAVFATLTILPIGIAGYLVGNLPPITQEARLTNPTRPRGEELTTNPTNSTNQKASPGQPRASATGQQPENLATEITEDTKTPIPYVPRVANHDSLDLESFLNQCAAYLPWVWIVGTPLTFLLLASGLIGTERLRRSCDTLHDGSIRTACDELQRALRVGRRVGVAICNRIATPLLVGVVRPMILLPPAALNGWTTQQLEMVLVHELVHVRRWDNAVNLAQRIVESLLFFHPAVWVVSGWVRRDREDCCDAAVVRHTAAPQAYAELLLALATHQPLAGLASGMAQHPLAHRVRRILKLEDEPMRITRKGFSLGVIATIAVFAIVLTLPTTDAEEAVSGESNVSREAERVADERSTAEQTTNQKASPGQPRASATGQHPEESATEHTEETEKTSLFPTLEEQRAADLAYKLLGVEVEKLTPEELQRVKAKGYKGGLKVLRTIGFGTEDHVMVLRAGDLLVGLHVWPTESLDQITQILSRDDLDQLSPLKFYALRAMPHHSRGARGGGYGGEMGEAEVKMVDQVVTGRAQVDLVAWRAMRSSTDAAIDSSAAISGEAPLLYDGKTFDEWRTLWKTELKTEKRIECIKALAAFGRAGKGKEAAEAILDVAAEYDFGKREGSSAGDLKSAISQVLGYEGIDGRYWLPLLIERLKTDPDKWSSFAERVLSAAYGKDLIPGLKQLARDDSLSANARGAALAGLAGQPEIASDPEAVAMVRKALQGDKPVMQILNRLRFTRLDLFPEQLELLLHHDEQIRHGAFAIAQSGGADSEVVLDKLLEVLDDPARSTDHEKAIIALHQLNGYYHHLPERRQRVTDRITEILLHGDAELLPASLVLMSSLKGGNESLVINELGDKLTDERRQELESALKQTEELESQMGGGSMYGGGGGMF